MKSIKPLMFLLVSLMTVSANAGIFDDINKAMDIADRVKGHIPSQPSNPQQPSGTQQFPGNIFEPASGGAPVYIAGTWSSDWGDIRFQQKKDGKTQVVDKNVSGSYSFYDGSGIYGTMNGNVLEGYWVQPISTRKCASSQYGSRYWGKIRFTFSGNQFTGLSGYCDSEPDKNSEWNGRRK